jgi:hypothetical protein
LSPYHTSLYFVDHHNGIFTWNSYNVEGVASPVTHFNLMRDSVNTNTWRKIGSASGTITSMSDPTYSTYQGIGNWRVDATTFHCLPTLKMSNPKNVQAPVLKSQSNIRFNRTGNIVGIQDERKGILVYPNPSRSHLTVSSIDIPLSIQLVNGTGEIFYSVRPTISETHIDLSNFSAGVYFVTVLAQDGEMQSVKIIINYEL